MSLVVKSNVRHRHPKGESKNTRLFTEFLGHPVCSCFSHSKLVRARSRDIVSLN